MSGRRRQCITPIGDIRRRWAAALASEKEVEKDLVSEVSVFESEKRVLGWK